MGGLRFTPASAPAGAALTLVTPSAGAAHTSLGPDGHLFSQRQLGPPQSRDPWLTADSGGSAPVLVSGTRAPGSPAAMRQDPVGPRPNDRRHAAVLKKTTIPPAEGASRPQPAFGSAAAPWAGQGARPRGALQLDLAECASGRHGRRLGSPAHRLVQRPQGRQALVELDRAGGQPGGDRQVVRHLRQQALEPAADQRGCTRPDVV